MARRCERPSRRSRATAAAALANIDVIENETLVPRVRNDAGPYFQEKLRSFTNHRAVGEVRGYGLIGALKLIPREGKAALTPTSMPRQQSGRPDSQKGRHRPRHPRSRRL